MFAPEFGRRFSMAERADFTFVVKEGSQGKPWIAAEQLTGGGLICFDLVPGTTMDQAQELARHMRTHIRGITTLPVGPQG
jgi:hypothetical protein